MTNLVGTYQISKANLLPTHQADFHLIISKRHKASARKPKDYLLIYQAGSFRYISSLYPAEASVASSGAISWHLDYQGGKYCLQMNQAENRAEIRHTEAGSNQVGGADTQPGGAGDFQNALV